MWMKSSLVVSSSVADRNPLALYVYYFCYILYMVKVNLTTVKSPITQSWDPLPF